MTLSAAERLLTINNIYRDEIMSKFRSTARRCLLKGLSSISPKMNFAYRYYRVLGRKINLKDPKGFNEKIVWLELNRYKDDPLVIQCSDKYRVREYVEQNGCGETLVRQLGSWEKVSDIPWDELPQSFVLKWNFGAGFNIICADKSKLDIPEACKKLEKWSKEKYWLMYGEMHYSKIPRRIVCEEYLSDLAGENNSSPDDYKLYCINGKVMYILVCSNRKGMHADYVMYDRDWNLLDYTELSRTHKERYVNSKPPAMLEKAIEYSERLSKPFPFVRADWFISDDKLYFGELTFTPCGGVDDDIAEGEWEMGDMLKLN